MPIIYAPRRIRIDLDPTGGFPVTLFVESTCYIEENGGRIADLPVHIESLAPDSDMAKSVLGELASTAMAALLTYQAEVQRLAGELATTKAEIAAIRG